MFGRSSIGQSRRSAVTARSKGPAPSLQHHAFQSPTRGWYTAANLATSPPNSAQVLENFYPTLTGLSMRRGCLRHATCSSVTRPVESMMSYVGGTTRRLFAAAGGKIFNVSSVADPNVEPAADVTGQTSDYYSHLNVTNPAGDSLLQCANGTDEIQTYDGSAWAPLVSGGLPGQLNGLASDTVDHLNNYRNRIWMTNRTKTAYYLPTDSIAGTVGEVALEGVFRRGGYVMFTATWSMDSGDGLDDRIVFVTSEGEIAVYQGDPVDARWEIVGLYDCSPPLGKNAFLKVGGDLLILTVVGLVPMSAVIKKDPAALALAAVSRGIQPDWMAEVHARGNLPWEMVKWTSRNVAYVTCPVASEESVTPPICFAVNLETGAWSKVTGWNTRCWALHDGQVYFGTGNGAVMQADVTGFDDGQLIYYTYVGSTDHLKAVGKTKTVRQARATFRSRTPFDPALSISTDYEVNLLPYPASAAIGSTPNEWDVGKWDQAKWDVSTSQTTINTGWVSVGQTGFAHAPQVQITSGSAAAPAAELILFEVLYEVGGEEV